MQISLFSTLPLFDLDFSTLMIRRPTESNIRNAHTKMKLYSKYSEQHRKAVNRTNSHATMAHAFQASAPVMDDVIAATVKMNHSNYAIQVSAISLYIFSMSLYPPPPSLPPPSLG